MALVLPLFVGGVTHSTDDSATPAGDRSTIRNVTFVSEQGRATVVDDHAGRLVAVDTDTREPLWVHDDYRRYMDVDPLDDDRLLVVAGRRSAHASSNRLTDGESNRVAAIIDWRTDEVLETLAVPADTHDVDVLDDGTFVIADKHRHRIVVYDPGTDSVVWSYDFEGRFPESDGGPASGDWTHLNDVDAVDNGSAFLVSPRNFDRVMLINRSTREIEWTLGEEDNYAILEEQHNPVLLADDPPTVLVADSENDRVVEYRRRPNGSWEIVWEYRGQLHWPRDADRLPNGNTLVVDSDGDRVVEVTPDRRVVWEYETGRKPYDAERLRLGDEPAGPSMAEFGDAFEEPLARERGSLVERTVAVYMKGYTFLGWFLPSWVGHVEFVGALAAVALAGAWVAVEVVLVVYRLVGGRYSAM